MSSPDAAGVTSGGVTGVTSGGGTGAQEIEAVDEARVATIEGGWGWGGCVLEVWVSLFLRGGGEVHHIKGTLGLYPRPSLSH